MSAGQLEHGWNRLELGHACGALHLLCVIREGPFTLELWRSGEPGLFPMAHQQGFSLH